MTWRNPTTSEEYFGMPPLWEEQRRRQDYSFEQEQPARVELALA